MTLKQTIESVKMIEPMTLSEAIKHIEHQARLIQKVYQCYVNACNRDYDNTPYDLTYIDQLVNVERVGNGGE
jgi:hypothetical protein